MYSSSAQVHFISQHLLIAFGYQNPNNTAKNNYKCCNNNPDWCLIVFPLLLVAAVFPTAQTNAATVATLLVVMHI